MVLMWSACIIVIGAHTACMSIIKLLAAGASIDNLIKLIAEIHTQLEHNDGPKLS